MKFDYIWVIQLSQDVDLIDERLVIFDTLFLYDLDRHIVQVFSVLR